MSRLAASVAAMLLVACPHPPSAPTPPPPRAPAARPPAASHLEPCRTVIMGSLDRLLVERVIHHHRASLDRCTCDPETSGTRILVRFIISPTGQVMQASFPEPGRSTATVQRCLVDEMKTWRFPTGNRGGIVIVTLLLVLNVRECEDGPLGLDSE